MAKKMLGDTIYRLRKEKDISQSELGKLVGVSNKAVSKWETYEANPDISLLPILAESLGVSIEELLTDIKTEKNSTKPREAKIFGIEGMAFETPEEYEFTSDKKTKNGSPYLHIHIGKQFSTITAKARGVVAIGNNAKGIISVGLFSIGLISFGLLAFGFLAFGLIAAGFAALGSFATGGAAFGTIAVGILSAGALSVGFVSYGAVAVGYYAHTSPTGLAIGKYTFYNLMINQ